MTEPQIFTFYSFKGGVGRTMALLNIAYGLVAKGRNVLVVDMDLEAPGLSGFLSREQEIPHFPRHDMLDLLQWAKDSSQQATEEAPLDSSALPPLSDYTVSVSPEKLATLPHKYCELGRLDVIPIEVDRNYYDRLPTVGITNMDRETLLRVGGLLRAWVTSRRFALDIPDYYGPVPPEDRSAAYDYILIDSRTGSTEVGGLCIGPLSDQLVVLCGLNDQNIEDTRHFLIEVGLLTSPSAIPPKLAKPTLFVASPVPTGELKLKTERLKRLTEALGSPAVELTYHPQMALMETIFVRDYTEDDLARRYQKLLRRILVRAGDHGELDPSFLEPSSAKKSISPEARTSLRSLLRATSVSEKSQMLFLAISQTDFDFIENDEDFQLFDRIFRALENDNPSLQIAILIRWSGMLRRWGLRSLNNDLRYKRFSAAIERLGRIIVSRIASAQSRSQALLNRGVMFGDLNQAARALADYDAVIEMEDALAAQKAKALFNRGVTHRQQNQVGLAIADFTAVIEMDDAPAEQKANARINRGVVYGEQNQVDREIADYTAVIEMDDAPAENKAKALTNRGWQRYTDNQLGEAIADFRKSILLVPTNPVIQANFGLALLVNGELDSAMSAYDFALKLANTDELLGIAKDLTNAQVNNGPIPGIDDVLSRIELRIAQSSAATH